MVVALLIAVGLFWLTVHQARSVRSAERNQPATDDSPLEALFAAHLDELVRADRVAEIEALALTSESFPFVADALRQTGAEDALLRLLARNDRRAKLAAIEALCYAGTMKSVEPLHALTVGILADAEVRNAAMGAIARIRRPMRGVEPGLLSLSSTGEGGALTLAGGAGSLSLKNRKSSA